LTGAGIRTIAGNVTPAGDLDYFQITVPAGPMLTLRARTYATAGDVLSTCDAAVDTLLNLYDSGGTLLESNDNIAGLANRCSIIDGSLPDADPLARLLPGTYYLRVSHYSSASPQPAGPYYLHVELE
jgi:hypothetical protein